MLQIDGSQGEGGGQILRSSLTLSLLVGKPFRIERIRARRRRPGLMRQHLTAVRAATEISGASVAGDRLGSTELTFSPGPVRAGDYSFSVGTAGSTSLVFQTVLPALAVADAPSSVELRGGTHNSMAPPFDFLVRTLFPLLARIGPRIEGTLHRAGFYPAGGGHVVYRVEPVRRLERLTLVERGRIQRRAIVATVSALATEIGSREIKTLTAELGWDRTAGRVERIENPAGPGNVITAEVDCEHVTALFTGFGERGVRAEQVAKRLAREVRQYLEAGVPVGPHLADQLLLWCALAGGGRFRTVEPTAHTRSQCVVVRDFLGSDIACEQIDEKVWEIRVSGDDAPVSG